MSPYFDYELTAFPMPLFKDNFMHKAAKAQLAKPLTDSMNVSEHKRQAKHVLDGGTLLHRVKWGKKVTYQNMPNSMCAMYVENMERAALFLMAMNRDHL